MLKTTIKPAVEPVTLTEAKAHLRVSHADEDSLIESLIEVAREKAESITGRAFIEQTIEQTGTLRLPGLIMLYRSPLISVESVTVDGVAADYVQSGRTLDVDTAGEYVVTYVAGMGDTADAVPTPVKQWILLELATLYAHRESAGENPVRPHSFVDSLLDPYRVTLA